MKHVAIISFILVLLFSCKGPERLVYQDLSFLYGTDVPVIKRKVFQEKDSLSLFISFSKTDFFTKASDIEDKYVITGKMSGQMLADDVIDLDSIPIRLAGLDEDEERIILRYRIPYAETNVRNEFFLKIYDRKKDIVRLLDMGQIFRKESPEKIFLFRDSISNPVTEEYFDTDQPVTIEGISSAPDSVSFAYYKQEFEPAKGPDKIFAEEIWSGEYKPDSTGYIKLGEPVSFSHEGLIVLSQNSEIPGCFSVRIGKDHYPFLRHASELIDPLVYITAPDEYRKLKTHQDPKIALDSFWLGIGGTKEFTRKLIKDYYSKVEFANRYFTTFKEGWKTDKGMIFIMYGPPVLVNRYENIEEWHYEDLFGKDFYTFAFIRKPVFLIHDHYELIRREEHSEVWYPLIEKLRKGIIIK
jgi:GWxTD domain-containing protein